jgi:hypothetical protein
MADSRTSGPRSGEADSTSGPRDGEADSTRSCRNAEIILDCVDIAIAAAMAEIRAMRMTKGIGMSAPEGKKLALTVR